MPLSDRVDRWTRCLPSPLVLPSLLHRDSSVVRGWGRRGGGGDEREGVGRMKRWEEKKGEKHEDETDRRGRECGGGGCGVGEDVE